MPSATQKSSDTAKPPRPKRCIPLSLRLFVAMMVLLFARSSLWIGVPACRRFIAIRELDRLGGHLRFNEAGPGWLRKHLGDAGRKLFDDVEWINLGHTSFDDSHVRYLNVFPIAGSGTV